MSYTPVDNVNALPQERRPRESFNDLIETQPIDLTPEELRVLKNCVQEGVIKRAIPVGLVCGIGGMMAAKGGGPLWSTKYGAKPAAIGLGIVGYFIGRFSYYGVCTEKVLQVPNGNLRKIRDQMSGRIYVDPSENYYANIEPKYDPEYIGPNSGSDIDIPSISSFDTTPSEYYKENTEAPKENPPQNYTSYDDLRRQNREEYSKRMYGETVRRVNPQERIVRRPPPPSQAEPPEQSGGMRTKYGDVWDA